MINTIRVFFLRSPRGGSLLDRLLSVGIRQYQKAFGLQSDISHVILQFGSYCYETTLEGTVSYEFTEELFDNPRILGWWEVNPRILEMTEQKFLSVASSIHVLLGRKLDVIGSLRYLLDLFVCDFIGVEYEEQTKSEPPRAWVKGDKMYYSLPFTCCAPVELVLSQLFGVETTSTSHLPVSILLEVLGLSSQGIGEFHLS